MSRALGGLCLLGLIFFTGCMTHSKSSSDPLPLLALLALPSPAKVAHEWNADFTDVDVPDVCTENTSFFERTFQNQKTITIQADSPMSVGARIRLFRAAEEIPGIQTIQMNQASLVTAPLENDALYNVELTDDGMVLARRSFRTMPPLTPFAAFLNVVPAGNVWNFVFTFAPPEQATFHSDTDYVYADLKAFVPGGAFACELGTGSQAGQFPGIWTLQFQGRAVHADASDYDSLVLSYLPGQTVDNLTLRETQNGGIRVFKD